MTVRKQKINEPEIPLQYEPFKFLPNEHSQHSTHESLAAKIVQARPYVETNLRDPFEAPSPDLLVAKR